MKTAPDSSGAGIPARSLRILERGANKHPCSDPAGVANEERWCGPTRPGMLAGVSKANQMGSSLSPPRRVFHSGSRSSGFLSPRGPPAAKSRRQILSGGLRGFAPAGVRPTTFCYWAA